MSVESIEQQPVLTRRQLRDLEREAARQALLTASAPSPVAVEAAAPESLEPQQAATAPQTFLSRRELREAERREEAERKARVAAEAASASAAVVAEKPELFAEAAEEETEAIATVTPIFSSERIAETAPLDIDDLPAAPLGEPEVEIPAAFRAPEATSRSRVSRRIRQQNRVAASAGRVGGGVVALSVLAGSVVLGAGSAAAIGAIGHEDSQADVNPQATAQQLTVGESEEAASEDRTDNSTAVMQIGSAAAMNLASGVARPDATTFTNDITANVQWPFPMGVAISDGYGPRSGIDGANPFHAGVDFTPGEGTPIGVIADGVVSAVDTAGGSTYGVNVTVEHVINGVRVTSLYAHMLSGSPTVTVGQTVHTGDELGLVGNTGLSTGAHMHLEIRLNAEVSVNPLHFLKRMNVQGIDVTLPTNVSSLSSSENFTRLPDEQADAYFNSVFPTVG